MSPEKAIEVTKAMKEMGVMIFELETLKVQFHPQVMASLPSLPESPRAEDSDIIRSQINERLLFGSSM